MLWAKWREEPAPPPPRSWKLLEEIADEPPIDESESEPEPEPEVPPAPPPTKKKKQLSPRTKRRVQNQRRMAEKAKANHWRARQAPRVLSKHERQEIQKRLYGKKQEEPSPESEPEEEPEPGDSADNSSGLADDY